MQGSWSPRALLTNRNFLFLASIVAGMALGGRAQALARYTLPALALAMTVSATQVPSSALWPPTRLLRPMLLSILLNYALLSTVMLGLARWLIHEQDLWVGFVLSAAVPSGVAVIPFSYILGADTAFGLLGSMGVYLSAVVITPLMVLTMAGQGSVPRVQLLTTLLQLLVIPLLLSRLLNWRRLAAPLRRWRGVIVDYAFVLVIVVSVGVNRDVFTGEVGLVGLIAIITFARSFGLALALDWLLGKAGLARPTRLAYVLMATLKNSGLAAGTALALYGDRAAVPAAVGTALMVPYLVWLGMHWGLRSPAAPTPRR